MDVDLFGAYKCLSPSLELGLLLFPFSFISVALHLHVDHWHQVHADVVEMPLNVIVSWLI